MSNLCGKNGKVKFGTAGAEVLLNAKEWTSNIDAGQLDVSTFEETGANFKKYISCLRDWKATVTCIVTDSGDEVDLISAIGNPKSLLLYITDTIYISSGTVGAILTSFDISTPVGGEISLTLNFQGTGEGLTVHTS